MVKINLIIGGASFGGGAAYSTVGSLRPLLDTFKSHSIKNIDTAARYPPFAPGTSEKLIHDVEAVKEGFVVDTKILNGGPGSLNSTAIRSSFEGSLKALGVEKVNVLYCHLPDYETPLEETARAFDEIYREGKFEKWGVSNFSAAMLKDLLEVCEEKGYVKPTVYQGQYNPLCRGAEPDLFPLLRANGITYNAFSPLAGGFFTGNLTRGGAALKGTRYEPGNPLGNFHSSTWNRPSMHTAFEKLSAVIEPLGIKGPEASLRWLVYHSALRDGDGLILGFSKISQFESNVEDIGRGPLPQEVVDVLESIWGDVEGESPAYYS